MSLPLADPQPGRRCPALHSFEQCLHQQRKHGGGNGALQNQTEIVQADTGENRLAVAACPDQRAQRGGAHIDHCSGLDAGHDRAACQRQFHTPQACPRWQSDGRGAALVLDLSQSLGVLPPDLLRWQPDFVVSVGHKWLLGPMGLAWLWVAPQWRTDGLPIEEHWIGRDAGSSWEFPAANAPGYRGGARRFDAGGVADPLRIAMATVALQQLNAWQPARIAAALGELTAHWDAALQARGLGSWCTPGHAPHLTALQPPAAALDAVATALGAGGVVCTRRHGRLRIAPHLSVTDHALSQVVAALPDR